VIVNYGGRASGRVAPAAVAASIGLFQAYTSDAISVSSPPANKFDLIAEVAFTGRTSSTVHRCQMYWDGTANQYRFKFFGERAEVWDYEITADGSTGTIETTTNVPELDGVTGSIEVTEDSAAYGLIKANGARWARQKGAHDTLEDFVANTSMAFLENF